MREDGAFFLNQNSIAESEVRSQISSLMDQRSEKTMFLKAAEGLSYGRVLEMMDVCRRAGAYELALVTRDVIR
jgi:biopolymer transport protein ExbD